MRRKQLRIWMMAFFLGAAGVAGIAGPSSAGGPAVAGSSYGGGTSYYEPLLNGQTVEELATSEPALPQQLAIYDGYAHLYYELLANAPGQMEWRVLMVDYEGWHESVDAVYDMILVLPLPSDVHGNDEFQTTQVGVALREGALPPSSSIPLIYGAEKLVLKRNVALEKAFLPGVVSATPHEGKLPSLAGTGFRYTLWDAVVRYDPSHEETLQGWGRLRYQTDDHCVPPDASDERMAAYLITWIPSLPADMPPYTLRMDVTNPY